MRPEPKASLPSASLALALALMPSGAGCAAATPAPNDVATAAPARAVDVRWRSAVLREHPLVGRIYDVAAGAFVDESTVVARVAAARFVLLGEKHDNADHHVVQARLLGAMVERGRRPAVAFEMIDPSARDALVSFFASNPTDAAGLGDALDWRRSGWPPFEFYQPIAQIAVERRLLIVPANVPREVARRVARGGLSVLGPKLVAALGLQSDLPTPARAALEAELRDAHCGQLPEEMIAPMADAQRARDAAMARALTDNAGGGGAVLIAGNGHVRDDRGVPWYLAKERGQGPETVVSFASIEVVRGIDEPRAYAPLVSGVTGVTTLPFTFVLFTPRVDEHDPCAKFHRGDRADLRANPETDG